MSVLEISVETRGGSGKGPARQTRMKGMVPGVVYGETGQPCKLIAINANKLRLTLIKRPTMLKLSGGNVDGINCIVREIQRHPVSGDLVHIDLQPVSSGHLVKMMLPVRLVGNSIGVKEGGVLDLIFHSIELEIDPTSAPDAIEVDITHVGMNSSVHFGDVALPQGAKLVADATDTLLVIHPAKTHDTTYSNEPTSNPEVLSERKKDEEK